MLKLGWNNETGTSDLQVIAETGALAEDEGLDTVVLLSLFTDAEATAAEIAAAGLDEQRGWWGDAEVLRDPGAPRLGSKLWLLSRQPLNLPTMRRAEGYARDALAWLIDQGLADSVSVTATRPRPDMIALDVVVRRPNKLIPAYRRLWEVSLT